MSSQIDLSGQWKRSMCGRDIDFVQVPSALSPAGEYLLERDFAMDGSGSPDDRFFLVTEGVLASAKFSINGHDLGIAGPWATYRFEIPRNVLKSSNSISAHVRDIVDDFGPMPGRRFDGGLVRHLYIDRRPATFLESFGFSAEVSADLSSATCSVMVDIDGKAGKSVVDLVLRDRETGLISAESTATADAPAKFTVKWPRLWSPSRPNLYTLTATLRGQNDSLTEHVGFRRIETRGQDFFINNQRLFLKGVCRHEFNYSGGYSPTFDDVHRELAMIKHAGFNYIRLVHSPHGPSVCRIAAELGILVSEEPGTCFHNLGDEAIAAPAMESLQRTIKRDRNVPSIFAWLIYNECNPNTDYAVRAAKVCREMDPGCRLAMADCSGQNDNIKAMVNAADLTFYGINVYSYGPKEVLEKMAIFADRPLVITEWGGVLGQGNPRVLKDLCDDFVIHSREGESLRAAGSAFWAWSDYEEYSRALPAAIDGWTIEGLVDRNGQPKPDLAMLSAMCLDIDLPPVPKTPRLEILAQAPRREEKWETVSLTGVEANQKPLADLVDHVRGNRLIYSPWTMKLDPRMPKMPQFGRMLIDGIEFRCRDTEGPAHPLMLGKGCDHIVIPVEKKVRAVAVLGHVAFAGGYPASAIYSVHHADAEVPRVAGALAAEYEFVFDNDKVVEPLRHGMEILRANNICRWWTPAPRSPNTRPAVQTTIHPSYEILRVDLWEKKFAQPKYLKAIHWRLRDMDSIQMMYAVSVLVDGK